MNVYRSPTGRIISFMVKSDDENWDIVGLNNAGSAVSPERRFDKWPIAQGPLVSSPQKACILVDNLNLAQRLILDHTDVGRPRRAVIEAAMAGRCGCPLQDYCLSPRSE
ncbi:hypothetical protein [Lutibaculum baratangense]|uniref:Uncharacterized protein n=1 Tax=Lutibaculum baratangense AMV1 TaxID=631454 RepID=V4RFG3_9HYPH|nr:hypothetical protein [Lutibaculum baratangense]ESR24124.1 hypothetical protein N177_2573 [Lutibaculum baratangense AMV1]